MTNEYWCERRRHWAKEVRFNAENEGMPRCEECCSKDWNDWQCWMPTIREVKEPRYITTQHVAGDWVVRDSVDSCPMDYALTKSQAEEMAVLRNKWETDK